MIFLSDSSSTFPNWPAPSSFSTTRLYILGHLSKSSKVSFFFFLAIFLFIAIALAMEQPRISFILSFSIYDILHSPCKIILDSNCFYFCSKNAASLTNDVTVSQYFSPWEVVRVPSMSRTSLASMSSPFLNRVDPELIIRLFRWFMILSFWTSERRRRFLDFERASMIMFLKMQYLIGSPSLSSTMSFVSWITTVSSTVKAMGIFLSFP